MEWVLDSSVALRWVLEDEDSSLPDRFAQQMTLDTRLWVPDHFWFEVANALLAAVRYDRIPAEEVDPSLFVLEALPIQQFPATPSQIRHVMALAVEDNLSAYDAAYLELAITRQCGLATLDQRLMTAARSHNVPIPW